MKQLAFRRFLRKDAIDVDGAVNHRVTRSGASGVWRHTRQLEFLKALARRGVVADACKEAKVSRRQVYRWYEKYEFFREAWDAAIEVSTEMAEAELYRRGVEGFNKPIAYQGEITAVYKDYSDACLRLLLQSRKPEKYATRQKIEAETEGQVSLVWNIPIPVQEKPTS